MTKGVLLLKAIFFYIKKIILAILLFNKELVITILLLSHIILHILAIDYTVCEKVVSLSIILDYFFFNFIWTTPLLLLEKVSGNCQLRWSMFLFTLNIAIKATFMRLLVKLVRFRVF